MIRHGVAIQCELVAPGRLPHGPGWYLAAANGITEAGPFGTRWAAVQAAEWLEDRGYGVNPSPYKPFYSSRGVLVGIRRKDMVGSYHTTETGDTTNVDHHPDGIPLSSSGD